MLILEQRLVENELLQPLVLSDDGFSKRSSAKIFSEIGHFVSLTSQEKDDVFDVVS
jgi:hypothetical protein